MTGFARVRRMTPQGEIVLSLRGVNHRGLDPHFHMASDFDPLEQGMRKAITAQVIRGHLDVRLQWVRARGAGKLAVNQEMLKAYVEAYRAAAKQYSLLAQVDLNAAFQTPGVIADGGSQEPGPEVETAVEEAMAEALNIYNAHREAEGADTAAVMRKHLEKIEAAAGKIEAAREGIVPALRARLEAKMQEMLGAAGADPNRLAQEAALLADRSDIGEEVARLKMHAARLREMLEKGGEMGKKLDFLLQEMNREVSTMLAKSGAAAEAGRAIVELALGVKSEVEKIREQSLNLE
ncbi:MAG: YicC family protein [Acidimicrobiia bacterium]|nr:YicC family protein [Acidimicrobiia bacterium]